LYTKSNDLPRYHWKNIGIMIICTTILLVGQMAGFVTIAYMII